MNFMNIILVVIPALLIALWEAPPLLKARQWKDLTVFTVILLAGFTLALLQVLGVKVPNPTKGLETLSQMIFGGH
jgi:hypothetical protein